MGTDRAAGWFGVSNQSIFKHYLPGKRSFPTLAPTPHICPPSLAGAVAGLGRSQSAQGWHMKPTSHIPHHTPPLHTCSHFIVHTSYWLGQWQASERCYLHMKPTSHIPPHPTPPHLFTLDCPHFLPAGAVAGLGRPRSVQGWPAHEAPIPYPAPPLHTCSHFIVHTSLSTLLTGWGSGRPRKVAICVRLACRRDWCSCCCSLALSSDPPPTPAGSSCTYNHKGKKCGVGWGESQANQGGWGVGVRQTGSQAERGVRQAGSSCTCK